MFLGRCFVLNCVRLQITGLEDCRDIDGLPSAPRLWEVKALLARSGLNRVNEKFSADSVRGRGLFVDFLEGVTRDIRLLARLNVTVHF